MDEGTEPTVGLGREHAELGLLVKDASGCALGDAIRQVTRSGTYRSAYLHNVMREVDARNRAQVITNARAHGLL